MSAGFAPAVAPDDLVHAPSTTAASASKAISRSPLVKAEHRHERLLRYLDRADPLHPSLAFLLLFQKLSLAGDVAAVALGQHVLPHRRDRLAGDHLAADRSLQRHLEHLPRNDRLELFDKFAALHLDRKST